MCCPPGSTGTTTASDSLPAPRPLPGSTPVIGHGLSTGTGARFGRGGPPQFPPPPSERSAPSTPGSPSRLRLQDLHRFHGLHREQPGSALPQCLTTRQASLHATDRSVASPKGLSTLGSALARFQARTPACYRASWQLPGPDFHRQATTSFRSGHDRWTITSCSLGAPAGVLGAVTMRNDATIGYCQRWKRKRGGTRVLEGQPQDRAAVARVTGGCRTGWAGSTSPPGPFSFMAVIAPGIRLASHEALMQSRCTFNAIRAGPCNRSAYAVQPQCKLFMRTPHSDGRCACRLSRDGRAARPMRSGRLCA